MDKAQQLKKSILHSTLKLFAIVFPMLMVISISRSLDTGWQVLYSVQIFLVIVLVATYFLRNKISNASITIIITVFFFILGTAASFRNENAMFYVFGTLIGIFYFSSYFSRKSTTFLGIVWGVSIGFIFYQIYGIMLDAIMFSIGIPFLTYLPISLHLQYQENDKKVNHQLETALQSIKEKNKKQEQIFAIIGHELRTPATAINMIINQERYEETAPKGKIIKEISEHLISVLDDMKALVHPEKVIEGKVVTTSVLVTLSQAIQVQDRLFQETNLRVYLASDDKAQIACRVNAQLLRQISLNLIKNCAFHSCASYLWIKVVAKEIKDNLFVEVRFEDNGKGIAVEYQETLFDTFIRGDTDADGIGLGLYLSREFARKHLHGDLRYEDRNGGGAIFILTMKLPKSSVEIEIKPKTANPLKDKEILFVEDNELIRMMTEVTLSKEGAKITAAKNGLEAWKLAQENDYDVVITDLFMPDMDGYELTRHLRYSGFNKPIIGITAAVVGHEQEKLLHVGASAVIEKPVNIESIKQILSEQ